MKTLHEAGDLSQYDGSELSLVVEFTLPDGTRACEPLVTLDLSDVNLDDYLNPELFYSVYLHVKTGGVLCIADFTDLDSAQIYCHCIDALLEV